MANPVPLDDALLERYGNAEMVPVAHRRRRTRRHKDSKAVQIWQDHPHRRFRHIFCLRVIPTREAKTFRLMVQALTLHARPLLLVNPGSRWPPAVLFVGLDRDTVPDALRIFLSQYGVIMPQPLDRRQRRVLIGALHRPLVASRTA
ncbi:MAG: hypothetical protein ACP5QO_15940 [Clostridia bacterium]